MQLKRRQSSSKEIQTPKETWETIGLEMLHQKYKYEFTPEESYLIKEMLKQGPPPLQYRQKLWLISSGAAREIKNNKGYYNKLLQYSKIVPCPSENQIKLDLRRTFPEEKECMTETFIERLKNILICYSIRNTSVGYCQGMNFICGRLLLIMGNEEQAFWLFIQIMEKILPIIYYSELVGIVIETTIVENLISLYFPELYKFIMDNNFNIPLRNFIHKWMVCLFTQTLSPEMVYSFLDYFFLEGTDFLLIKNSLFIIAYIHDKIFKSNDFEYMYNLFNEGTLKIHDVKTMIYFLDEKKYEFGEKKLIEFKSKIEQPITKKLNEESLAQYETKFEERKKSLKNKGINCNPNWPTCFYDDYTQNVIDVLILKESKSPYIIKDYYYIKNDGYPDDTVLDVEGYDKGSTTTVKEVLIQRHKHVCDNAKLVDNSKIFLDDEYKKIDFNLINTEQNNGDDHKIYDRLKDSKDFDNVVKEIKNEMEKMIKPMKMNEINNMIEINEKEENYYPKDYFFHILQ